MDASKLSLRFFVYFGFAGLIVLVLAICYRDERTDKFFPRLSELEAKRTSPAPTPAPAPGRARRTVPQPQSEIVPAKASVEDFPWLERLDNANLLCNRLRPPQGYRRIDCAQGSFGWWLQRLPLKPGKPPVRLFNGRPTGNDVHVAVADIDTGSKDLQQCADAVIRLRAEYLWSRGRQDDISFNFTSGDKSTWSRWASGIEPRVSADGRRVTWRRVARPDASYRNFKRYLETTFTYASTTSLVRELAPVDVRDIQVGDVFIIGRSPQSLSGHALIVVDMAQSVRDPSRKAFVIAQSYLPARDIHVLKNPRSTSGSPWYPAEFGQQLLTPEWTFQRNALHRFR